MSLQEKINVDWKEAMKTRDPKKDTISLIKNELKNKAIESRGAGDQTTLVDDAVAIDVLAKMAKQRREAIESFKSGGREDLAQKESSELAVIESYLPKQMTDEEVKALVQTVMAEVGATSIKDMGKVMGAAVARSKGRADGSRIQSVVRQLLGS